MNTPIVEVVRVASAEQLRDDWLAWGRSLTPMQRLSEGWLLSVRLFGGRDQSESPEDKVVNRVRRRDE